jgi:hypothetical protein
METIRYKVTVRIVSRKSGVDTPARHESTLRICQDIAHEFAKGDYLLSRLSQYCRFSQAALRGLAATAGDKRGAMTQSLVAHSARLKV